MVAVPKFQPIRSKQQLQARVPFPLGGLNLMKGTMEADPMDAYVMDNLIARPIGLEIRKGWRYWIPQADSFSGEVRSMFAFVGQSDVNSRVFAGVNTGNGPIYDVTAANTAPVLSLTPSSIADIPGEWYTTNMVTPFASVLAAVSSGAGYYVYDSTSAWTEIVDGDGVVPFTIKFPAGDLTTSKDLAFVWTWKNRLWFMKPNTAVCYYLPVGQFAGILEKFDFGAELLHGGPLAFATSWTYDSGQGIDDSLVLVSDEGDVILYEGTDPAGADTFGLKGIWYAGRIPPGRRGYCQYGGDVLLLTEYGVVRVSDLISGKLHTSNITGSIAEKINPLIARSLSETIDEKYWFILSYPTEEFVFVPSPFLNENTGERQSYLMNSLTTSWSTMSRLDVLSAVVFEGQMIVGTRDGAVIHTFAGYTDGDTPDGAGDGDQVTGRVQGAFLDYGTPNFNKRMLRVKIYGQADGVPTFVVAFRSEYEFNVPMNVSAPPLTGASLWDVALWDDALWKAGAVTFRRWIGTAAYGKKMSMEMAIRGSGQTYLTDFEVLYETGIGL